MKKEECKICHISIGHNPDDDRIYYKELMSLSKKFRNVYFVAPLRKQPPEDKRIKIITFPFSKNIIKNAVSAYKISKKVRADIYHFHEFEFTLFALLLKFKYRRKLIYDAHETVLYYYPDFSRKPRLITIPLGILAQALEWICSIFMDYIITVTPWIAKGFRVFNKKVEIVYNYPLQGFIKPKDNYNFNEKIIFYHGQLSHARNIESIILAMKDVKEVFPDARLLIYGYGQQDYIEYLNCIIKSNDIDEVVKINQPVDYKKIPDLLKNALIGISSMFPNKSFQRAIQIKIFEFMAAGVPVLGCKTPANLYYIEKFRTGVIVDPPTKEKIADAIFKLLKNRDMIIEMGKNGIRLVKEKFNWDSQEKKLFKVYDSLIKPC